MRIGVVALVLAAACGKSQPQVAPAAPSRCTPLPFLPTTPVPEASAAAWLDIAGKPALLVVGDSGNHGAYGLVDPETGATFEQGKLPLGETSDDLEGLSAHDGVIYGLVSSGWVYAWKRTDGSFALVDGPYLMAPEDSDMVCRKPHKHNCARNYEGLCLAPHAGSNGCDGYAASKADGKLYCVTFDAGHRLVVHEQDAIEVDAHDRLADCTYDEAGTLWAADNLLGLAQVFRIEGGRAEPFDTFGPGFPEVIAVRGDVFYRMSDLGGAPSLMAKFRCSAVTK